MLLVTAREKLTYKFNLMLPLGIIAPVLLIVKFLSIVVCIIMILAGSYRIKSAISEAFLHTFRDQTIKKYN